MFNLISLFRSKITSQFETYDYDTAPRDTIILQSGHSVVIYKFKTIWMIMDAKAEWRTIEGVEPGAKRQTIEMLADAYFTGFEQAQREAWTRDHYTLFEEIAREYQEEITRDRKD